LEVLLGEPEAESFATGIANDTKRLASTISGLEAPIVIEARKGPDGRHEPDLVFTAWALLWLRSISPMRDHTRWVAAVGEKVITRQG